MQTDVTFRKVKPSDALRNHVEEKIQKIKKFVDEPVSAHVVLEVTRNRHRALIQVNAHGLICQGEHVTQDLYSAIDGVIEKVEKQLRRNRDRAKRHHDKTHQATIERLLSEKPVGRDPEATEAAADGGPRIIRTEPLPGKPMSVEEAALQLAEMAQGFIVFRNDRSEQVNVLYKRKDGAFGLIDPSL